LEIKIYFSILGYLKNKTKIGLSGTRGCGFNKGRGFYYTNFSNAKTVYNVANRADFLIREL